MMALICRDFFDIRVLPICRWRIFALIKFQGYFKLLNLFTFIISKHFIMSKHARNPFHPAGENQSGTLVTFSLGQPWYRPAFHSPTPWTRNTILQRRALTFGAYFLWPSSDAPNNAPKNCGCTRLSADVKRRARKGSPLFARAWWTSTDCGERRRLGKWLLGKSRTYYLSI